jgi:hypothetical protein
MLAEGADFVVGVDTHGQRHSFALVEARRGALVCEWELPASAQGYRRALELARQRGGGQRLWALEGSGCYGAGLARFLLAAGEWVREVERPLRRGVQGRLKTDSLDALRAARAAFERPLATPRAGGAREALRVLLATREQAVQVRRVGLNQLRRAARHRPRRSASTPLRAQPQTAAGPVRGAADPGRSG